MENDAACGIMFYFATETFKGVINRKNKKECCTALETPKDWSHFPLFSFPSFFMLWMLQHVQE